MARSCHEGQIDGDKFETVCDVWLRHQTVDLGAGTAYGRQSDYRLTCSAPFHMEVGSPDGGLDPVVFLRDLPVIATIPEPVAVRLEEMLDVQACAVPIKMPRFAISAIWKTEVDGLIEDNWIRQILKDLASTLNDEGLLAAEASPVVPSYDLLSGTQDPSSPCRMTPMQSGRR